MHLPCFTLKQNNQTDKMDCKRTYLDSLCTNNKTVNPKENDNNKHLRKGSLRCAVLPHHAITAKQNEINNNNKKISKGSTECLVDFPAEGLRSASLKGQCALLGRR